MLKKISNLEMVVIASIAITGCQTIDVSAPAVARQTALQIAPSTTGEFVICSDNCPRPTRKTIQWEPMANIRENTPPIRLLPEKKVESNVVKLHSISLKKCTPNNMGRKSLKEAISQSLLASEVTMVTGEKFKCEKLINQLTTKFKKIGHTPSVATKEGMTNDLVQLEITLPETLENSKNPSTQPKGQTPHKHRKQKSKKNS